MSYDYNVICQVCRECIKASEATKRWDGYIVGKDHPGCFEHRHPLDSPMPPFFDDKPLPFTSPEPPDTFVSVTYSARADQTGLPVGTFDDNNGEM